MLAALAGRQDVTIRGFDLVEVNPLLHHNGTTALLDSRIILDFLGLIFDEDGLP
jgi:arginase family enzyme